MDIIYRAWHSKENKFYYVTFDQLLSHQIDQIKWNVSKWDIGIKYLQKRIFVGDRLKCFYRDDVDRTKPFYLDVTFLNGCFMVGTASTHEFFRLYHSDFEVIEGNQNENQ